MSASKQFTLSSTPTLIVDPGPTGRRALVQNLDGTNDAYVGGSGVASTNGVKIAHNAAPIEIPLGDQDTLYAIAAASTPTIAVLVTGP